MFSLAGVAKMRAWTLRIRFRLIAAFAVTNSFWLPLTALSSQATVFADDFVKVAADSNETVIDSAQDSTGRASLANDTEHVSSSDDSGRASLSNADNGSRLSETTDISETSYIAGQASLRSTDGAELPDNSGRARLPNSDGGVKLVSAVAAPSRKPDLDFTAEYQQLRGAGATTEASDRSYLTELDELIIGESSSWLFAKPASAETAQQDPSRAVAATYLDELNSLVKSDGRGSVDTVSSSWHRTVAMQEAHAGESTPRTLKETFRSISPAPVCNPLGGMEISSCFQPLSSIRIAGLSTNPPTTSKGSVELKRPEPNEACAYLSDSTPGYYLAAPYGVRRPSRNTHTLIHHPLYFEDPNLERCGRSRGCMTTAVSSVHFATTIAFLPYLAIAKCPNSCVTALPDCPTCHSFGIDAYCNSCLPAKK